MKLPLILLTTLSLTACSGGNSSSGEIKPKITGTGVDKSICKRTHGVTWDQFVINHQSFHNRVGWKDSPKTKQWHVENGSANCYPNRPKRTHSNPIGTHS